MTSRLSWLTALAVLGMLLLQQGLSGFAAEPFNAYASSRRWRDQKGDTFTFSGLRGRWTVITLAYSTCPSICAMTVSSLRKLVAGAGGSGPELVLLSIDPAHDTAESRAAFLKKQGVPQEGQDPSRWHFIAASEKATRELAHSLGMRFGQPTASKSAHISHTLRFVLVNPMGQIVSSAEGPQLDPEAFLKPFHAAGGRDGKPAGR